MKRETRLKTIYIGIYIVNFIIISFIAITIYTTSHKICGDYQARQFLETARYLPIIPSKVPIYSIIFLISLGMSSLIKNKLKNTKAWLLIILFFADLALCGIISYNTNFSYKGLFLFVVASVFLYVSRVSIKILFTTITLICFVVLDYDFLSAKMNILSFQHYSNFYNTQIQIYFFSLKNIMDSLNLVLFISFFFFIIQTKIKENKEYMSLNNQLKDKIDELKIANQKIEKYTEKSIELAKMKERNRLAREIHDILGHSLTSITIGIEACFDFIDLNPSIAKKHMTKIREIAQKGLNDVRRSVRALKIGSIEKYGPIFAIKQLIDEINTFSGVEIELNIKGMELKLGDNEAQVVYRAIQESITNGLRHGRASHIKVDLIFTSNELAVKVVDDGMGCHVINKGLGLKHIQERVEMLGGKTQFKSSKGKGFAVLLFIPIKGGLVYDQTLDSRRSGTY